MRITVVGEPGSGRPSDVPGGGAAVTSDGGPTLTTRDPAAVLSALARRDLLEGLQVRGATLEDVFLHLTGREYRA